MPPIRENGAVIGHYSDVKTDEFEVNDQDPNLTCWGVRRSDGTIDPHVLFTPLGIELEKVDTAASFMLIQLGITDERVTMEGYDTDLSFTLMMHARTRNG
jgi:hypothetical protein